jgi:hypothetical protein
MDEIRETVSRGRDRPCGRPPSLSAAVPSLEAFEPFAIDASSLPGDVTGRLWLLIDSLGVVENKAKIVAGTKTLHHLPPDLVVPIDRAWTGTFFQFHLPEWQDPGSQHRIFRLAYTQFAAVARRVQPERYVTGQGWRTSRSKVIDNALIGFCKAELGERPPSAEHAVNQVSFDVPGYPPAKNEALSMLGVNYSHASRIRLLLEIAGQACTAQGFVSVGKGHVALEVVLRALQARTQPIQSTISAVSATCSKTNPPEVRSIIWGHSARYGYTETTGRLRKSAIAKLSPGRPVTPLPSDPLL